MHTIHHSSVLSALPCSVLTLLFDLLDEQQHIQAPLLSMTVALFGLPAPAHGQRNASECRVSRSARLHVLLSHQHHPRRIRIIASNDFEQLQILTTPPAPPAGRLLSLLLTGLLSSGNLPTLSRWVIGSTN